MGLGCFGPGFSADTVWSVPAFNHKSLKSTIPRLIRSTLQSVLQSNVTKSDRSEAPKGYSHVDIRSNFDALSMILATVAMLTLAKIIPSISRVVEHTQASRGEATPCEFSSAITTVIHP